MCKCKTLKGTLCKNAPVAGSEFCRVHLKCKTSSPKKAVKAKTVAPKKKLFRKSSAKGPFVRKASPDTRIPASKKSKAAPKKAAKASKVAKRDSQMEDAGTILGEYFHDTLMEDPRDVAMDVIEYYDEGLSIRQIVDQIKGYIKYEKGASEEDILTDEELKMHIIDALNYAKLPLPK